MPILIDGHNLITRVPGLHLDNLDDENQLVSLLLEYCRLRRKQIDCYFDKASSGHPRIQKHGLVTAIFARPGKTADDEIMQKLVRLGAKAKNWMVVSSDASVRIAAKAARATVISAEAFAHDLFSALKDDLQVEKDRQEPSLNEEELEQWLVLFGQNEDEQDLGSPEK